LHVQQLASSENEPIDADDYPDSVSDAGESLVDPEQRDFYDTIERKLLDAAIIIDAEDTGSYERSNPYILAIWTRKY
jgi:hypothetical protein